MKTLPIDLWGIKKGKYNLVVMHKDGTEALISLDKSERCGDEEVFYRLASDLMESREQEKKLLDSMG